LNWVYGIVKAFLDWLRETPPPSVHTSKAPPDLQAELGADIDAAKHGVRDEGDPRP
jgi:hypothetical protein